MRTIKWRISIGLVGCHKEGEFEVEENVSEDEIEQIAREEAFECIDWNWEEKL